MTSRAADAPIPDELKRSVIAHYESRLRAHGPTAEGMDWKDEASQRLRFQILSEVCELEGRRVHEVGAGAGHLADYLREIGVRADYSGSDLSEAMVAAARQRHPELRFEHRDVLLDPPAERYDVLLCSGLFHVKLDHDAADWLRFVRATALRMYELCDTAIAFNLMSDRVDFRTENLYYADAGAMLDWCRRELSRFVVLRHDYPLYEYTIYVYREARRSDREAGPRGV